MAQVFDNLLSPSNEEGWVELQEVCCCNSADLLVIIKIQLFKISSEANQGLVRNAEQFGQLLARTLNEETPEAIKSKSNIGMQLLFFLYTYY